MSLQQALSKVLGGSDLTRGEAREAMKDLMSGRAKPTQIAAFLVALRMKGETVEEVTAFAEVMREFAIRVEPEVDRAMMDTCGTGGDRIKTFNVSTCAAFVVAAAGIPVAKHGNRSVTSKAGSADVLEVLGARISLEPAEVKSSIERIGFGFIFAPKFHPAMRYATPVRRELGVRTVFNILGPLTNPAFVKTQLLGVYDAALTEKVAQVLQRLGCERAMVVHGLDGLDEISTLGPTKISELRNGRVESYVVQVEDFGIRRAKPSELLGGNAEENAKILLRILRGQERGARRDIVLLNAGAALKVGGLVKDIKEGLEVASQLIDSGKAYQKLVEFLTETGGDIQQLRKMELAAC